MGARLTLVHMQSPIMGTTQDLDLVALEGLQHPGSSLWGRTLAQTHGSELLLCCGMGVDAQGSYRGE